MGKENHNCCLTHSFQQMGDSKSYHLSLSISLFCFRFISLSNSPSLAAEALPLAAVIPQLHTNTNRSLRFAIGAHPIKMDVVDVPEIFRQLRFARYGEGPLSKFKDWRDEHLWMNLLQLLINRCCLPLKLKTLVFVVSNYAKKYVEDPNVGWLHDDALKRDVISVFKSEPVVDQKGCLSFEELQVIIQNMNNTGLLVNDEQVDENCFNSAGRNSGGRKIVKRFRGSGSSSSADRRLRCEENFENIEMDIISQQLTYLRNLGRLSLRQVMDANRHFNRKHDRKHLSRIKLWSSMSLDDQVEYILAFSR